MAFTSTDLVTAESLLNYINTNSRQASLNKLADAIANARGNEYLRCMSMNTRRPKTSGYFARGQAESPTDWMGRLTAIMAESSDRTACAVEGLFDKLLEKCVEEETATPAPPPATPKKRKWDAFARDGLASMNEDICFFQGKIEELPDGPIRWRYMRVMNLLMKAREQFESGFES